MVNLKPIAENLN